MNDILRSYKQKEIPFSEAKRKLKSIGFTELEAIFELRYSDKYRS